MQVGRQRENGGSCPLLTAGVKESVAWPKGLEARAHLGGLSYLGSSDVRKYVSGRRGTTSNPSCTHTSIPFVHSTRELYPPTCREEKHFSTGGRTTPVFPWTRRLEYRSAPEADLGKNISAFRPMSS